MNQDERLPRRLQVDLPAALRALDGSRMLLHELAVMFCEDAPLAMEELKQAIEADDAAGARRAAHSLKGLTATFYAKPTIELAQHLELKAAAGELTELRDVGLEELGLAVASLIAELQEFAILSSPRLPEPI